MANVSQLEEAAILGDINLLYALIQVDPHILVRVDAIPFVDTPLHVAGSAGHLQFATEIMRLRPSFALKLNPQGCSPIHLALQNGHTKLVRRFVDINKDLVRVKGREGITPLHYLVSQTGDVDLLAEFLSACPDSIEDVTVRSETAFHIAVKYQRLEALQVLLGWLNRNSREGAAGLEYSILNWKDEAGNTILHLSALNDDIQALDLLINSKRMNLNAKNSENMTALDKATSPEIERKLLKARAKRGSSVEVGPTLADELRSKVTAHQKVITFIERLRASISDKNRDAYLVVATLVLTVIYQSALSPPGGIYQADMGANNSNATSSLNSTAIARPELAGKSVLSADNFLVLLLLNTVALLTTTLTILILIPGGVFGVQLVGPTLSSAIVCLYSMRLISPTPGTRYMGNIMIAFFVVIYYWVTIELIMNIRQSKILKKILRRLKAKPTQFQN